MIPDLVYFVVVHRRADSSFLSFGYITDFVFESNALMQREERAVMYLLLGLLLLYIGNNCDIIYIGLSKSLICRKNYSVPRKECSFWLRMILQALMILQT